MLYPIETGERADDAADTGTVAEGAEVPVLRRAGAGDRRRRAKAGGGAMAIPSAVEAVPSYPSETFDAMT